VGVEHGDIQPVVAGGIELYCTAGDLKEWRVRRVIVQHLAEIAKRLREGVAGRPFGLMGPQEAGQCFPRVGAVRLDRQTG
jgi:hypothetical protein